MFTTTYNKGFQMTFKNGLTISVQWGINNYCDRRDLTKSFKHDMNAEWNESPNAEIAVWDKDNTTFDFTSNDWVRGWVGADEVADWIHITKSASNLSDMRERVNELNLESR